MAETQRICTLSALAAAEVCHHMPLCAYALMVALKRRAIFAAQVTKKAPKRLKGLIRCQNRAAPPKALRDPVRPSRLEVVAAQG
jgi:hypothetical protein